MFLLFLFPFYGPRTTFRETWSICTNLTERKTRISTTISIAWKSAALFVWIQILYDKILCESYTWYTLFKSSARHKGRFEKKQVFRSNFLFKALKNWKFTFFFLIFYLVFFNNRPSYRLYGPEIPCKFYYVCWLKNLSFQIVLM